MTAEQLTATVDGLMDGVVADLQRLVRIPSIAFPGFPQAPVDEAARLTLELLAGAGLTAELIEIEGAPAAVYGELAGPAGAPTVLLYAHYDVQPAGDEDAWSVPPFSATIRDGQLVGRGTADDKSGIAVHLATLRAFAGSPPVNLKVIIEGEEETGRGTFEQYLSAHPERFEADVVVVADAGNWRLGEPTLTTTLRGLCVLDVEVRTLREPVHSGLFGGAAPDALLALSRILASLHDDRGDSLVAGLVSSPWAGRPVDPDTVRATAGVLDGVELVGTGPVAERLYTRPSITAIGLDAPRIETAGNATVPVARARLSCRLAPEQDPVAAQEAIAAHVRTHAPWGVQVTTSPGETARGAVLAADGPAAGAASAALATAYGKDAVQVGSGGAIPLCVQLSRALPQAEILLWGACDDGARIHSADERLDLGELHRAALAQVLFLQGLGDAAG